MRVDEQDLTRLDGSGPGMGYDLAGASGTLRIVLPTPTPWWAWVQLGGLLALALVAAPGVRRQGTAQAPRRVEAPVAARPEAPAPRRLAGGGR